MNIRIIYSAVSVLLLFSMNAQGERTISANVRSESLSKTSVSRQLCTPAVRQNQIPQVKQTLRTAITLQSEPNLIAAFVRAAFHDCITATPDKPKSGCNGSLRLPTELAHPNNARLGAALALIQTSVAGTCISVADGIQLAAAVAVNEAGGPDISNQLVSAGSPRKDALAADTVDNELPNRNDSYQQSLFFYNRKGLSATDLMSSYAGGHSLGGFSSASGILPFTTDDHSVSSSYSKNLVRRADGATGNLPGFNTLNSDAALIQNQDAVEKLRFYSGCTEFSSGCTQDDAAGLINLLGEFTVFLIKCSKMTGSTVGNPSQLQP